jgi:hypothetical protein
LHPESQKNGGSNLTTAAFTTTTPAIIYFGQFYKDYRSSPKSWPTFFLSIYYVLILAKKWLGYVLGDCFTNSSGHPERQVARQQLARQQVTHRQVAQYYKSNNLPTDSLPPDNSPPDYFSAI